MSSSTNAPGKFTSGVLWLLIIVYTVTTVIANAFPALNIPWTTPLSVFSSLFFALLHGGRRYGFRGIAVFLVVCLVISNILENIGVLSGFPFGHYHYTDTLGWKIYKVPVMIGCAYFGTGYLAWVLANILLGDSADHCRSRLALVGMPVIAAFMMVSWDVCMDPIMSTVAKCWIWRDGGGYFGVPFCNYLGWYFTVYVFYQVYALYLAKNPAVIREIRDKSYWYQAAAFFLIIGLGFPSNLYGGGNKPVQDLTGATWHTWDIHATAAIVAIVTILFTATLAFFRIARDEKSIAS
ncbi:MAG: carotenoid biosynthesis protein [Chthoniobacterales bacterium]